ncbi:MAG: hypothetical protein ACHQII_06875, partial [Bacteroidia bacterium]
MNKNIEVKKGRLTVLSQSHMHTIDKRNDDNFVGGFHVITILGKDVYETAQQGERFINLKENE